MTNVRVVVALAFLFALAGPAAAAVKICRTAGADVFVDNTGGAPVSEQFGKCADDPLVTAINLPPGSYVVDRPIIVHNRTNLTIRTAGLAGNIKNCQQLPAGSCARLIASSSPMACINNPGECHTRLLASGGGPLQARDASRIVFDHLIIDGSRDARRGSEVWKLCQNRDVDDHSKWGFNGLFANCQGTTVGERCEFTYNYTHHALCGTALRWQGNFGRIQGNASFDNGIPAPLLWADGLTIHSNNNGIVSDNHLVNNTDVALILGEAAGTHIESNWIQQTTMYAYAALMLGNFAETGSTTHPSGNYTGAYVRYNTIQCTSFKCGFGINFGPDPWSVPNYTNVYGGTVTQNNVTGARVLINFGGAGTSKTSGPVVTGNTLSGAPTVDMPIADGSTCIAQKNVAANLINNGTAGIQCDNWVTTDAAPLSMRCFRNCF